MEQSKDLSTKPSMDPSMNNFMLTISAGEWEGINHRPHHFMRRCAASGWTVIYLEPPASLIAPLKDKRFLKRWQNWRLGLRQGEAGVYLLAPPPILPFGSRYRWINKINQRLISGSVKRALGQLKTTAPDVYTFLPSAVDLLPFVPHQRVIYDCVDDHAAFTGLIDSKTIRGMEQELMRKAQVSFATAKKLYEDRKGWSSNFHIIPNGAEYERFAAEAPIPEDVADIPHPVAGFVGGISDWVDIDLIAATAKRLPEFTFLLIGPVLTDVSCLEKTDNVKILGPRPYESLPGYVRFFDVCLISFKINKLTESVNPIKMFEYLSAGKPVVSTPLPEVLAFDHVVAIAEGTENTAAALMEALGTEAQGTQAIEKRQTVARENSWDARWEAAVQLIQASGS
jgi:glycosyltransferase involved in cell wall biosynthesis